MRRTRVAGARQVPQEGAAWRRHWTVCVNGPARGGAPDSLILLMNGYGADAHDLIDLAPAWSQAVPGGRFVAPHAPEPCEGAPFGRQWFSLLDRSRPSRRQAWPPAAGVLGRFVAEEAAALGLPSAASR